jgi:ribonuclease E
MSELDTTSETARDHSAPPAEVDADATTTEGTTSTTTDAPSSAATESGGSTESGDGTNAASPARKRRRRGKRGGRNRRKTPAASTVPADTDDDGDALEPDDWNDAAADRGYTDDDVLVAAKQDAALDADEDEDADVDDDDVDEGDEDDHGAPFLTPSVPPPVAKAKPTNGAGATAAGGDTTSPAKKKRRRRGGRGRNKKPASAAAATAAPTTTHVEGGLDYGTEDGASVLESLDEATLERRRGLQRKGRATGRYMMVVHTHQASGRTHVAVLEGRNLIEHYVAEPQDDERNIDGNIYLGKVQNVQPGMEAAFVDIGTQKNAILYRGDVKFDPGDHDGERPRIERVLRNGDRILVQVTKNPIAHKGARLTQEVSLAGRFVVMVPNEPGTYGISKRLPDDERKRLRRILDRVKPKDCGLIVRTAAEGATEEELERDVRRLGAQWEQIDKLAKQVKPGTLLYKEPPLAIRVIREEFTKEYRAVVIEDRALYDEVHGYVEAVAPELEDRIEYYDTPAEGLPLFERYHIHEQLTKALDRKVWLPSGGSIVIEHTEALTVIDVNTGKNVGKSNLEETVYRNNLEAADVIARELRLRDVGGIIVIDFIDMESKSNREAVERAFRDALARDKTRTQVFPISELGLLEMTRKRVSEGLVESFATVCPECQGRGILIDLSELDS